MPEIDFNEKQYFGLNKMALARRLSLSFFCFLAYYWIENNDKSEELFFVIGIAIILFSVLLFFMLHFDTRVLNGSIKLDGLWTSRKIKIEIMSLVSAKRVDYSRLIIKYKK